MVSHPKEGNEHGALLSEEEPIADLVDLCDLLCSELEAIVGEVNADEVELPA